MAYKFLKSRQLKHLLNEAEEKQKKDIHDFSGGHLNETLLLQHYSAATRTSWDTAHLPESMMQRSFVVKNPAPDQQPQMKQALFEFSMGTTGVVPPQRDARRRPSPLKKYKYLKEQKERQSPAAVDSPSPQSLYSELEDGILIEELPAQELMLKAQRKKTETAAEEKKSQEGLVSEDTMFTTQTSLLTQQPQYSQHDLPLHYNVLPMHSLGITRADQYRKMRSFENNMLRKKDASEQKVLSGMKAVEHHERKLQQELKALNLTGVGPNFHKLQVYSSTLEDLIQESPTFSYILRCIKAEYDNYIAWLLDHQTSQQHLLREQVEQMASRGTSRPDELAQAIEHVTQLTEQAKDQLDLNERLKEALKEEREWLENAPELVAENTPVQASLPKRDQPMELAEEIENTKALILEKMDEVHTLRVKLREEFVPMTVCTHLEQCIKETEVEVQKLLKQNEYFERSIGEMDTELKEAIVEADTSEKDARRIWRKVNSTRGLPGHRGARQDSDDEEEEEESKWNWYIS